MNLEQHYRNLGNMYLAAPINAFYLPRVTVSKAESVIEIDLKKQHHHAGGGVHGAVYFKMLDDAAFFAVNSLETQVFVLKVNLRKDQF